MIQRKQTVFLFFAIVFCIVSLLMPIAQWTPNNNMDMANVLFNLYIKDGNGTLNFANAGLFALNSLSILLSLVGIFMYKNRKKQAKLCTINQLSLVIWYGYMAVLYWGYDPKYTFKPTFYIAFPLVALIFVFMAYKGIKADERLVKSLDRIR